MLTCHGAHYLLLVVKGKGHEPIALIDRTDTRKTSLTPDSIEQEKWSKAWGIGQSMACFAEHMMFSIPHQQQQNFRYLLHIVKL